MLNKVIHSMLLNWARIDVFFQMTLFYHLCPLNNIASFSWYHSRAPHRTVYHV